MGRLRFIGRRRNRESIYGNPKVNAVAPSAVAALAGLGDEAGPAPRSALKKEDANLDGRKPAQTRKPGANLDWQTSQTWTAIKRANRDSQGARIKLAKQPRNDQWAA